MSVDFDDAKQNDRIRLKKCVHALASGFLKTSLVQNMNTFVHTAVSATLWAAQHCLPPYPSCRGARRRGVPRQLEGVARLRATGSAHQPKIVSVLKQKVMSHRMKTRRCKNTKIRRSSICHTCWRNASIGQRPRESPKVVQQQGEREAQSERRRQRQRVERDGRC